MKKYLMGVFCCLILACGTKEDKTNSTTTTLVGKSKNPVEFNQLFEKALDNYFHLKDNFVLTNDSLVNKSATLFLADVDSLKFESLMLDSVSFQNAYALAAGISAETKALLQIVDMEEKRKSFQMISDQMYDLIKLVQYDREVLYHQYCPMAFNDAGAYWISRSSDIKNPYFGKKMLTCGEVRDTINFIKP